MFFSPVFTSCLTACLLMAGAGAWAQTNSDYLPLWQRRAPHVTDLMLVYQGGRQRPQWTPQRFAPYVSWRDPQQQKEAWLFDGFLFIEFADAKLHAFQPWPGVPAAQQADWLNLLDRQFAADDGVPSLEQACAAVAGRIGWPARPRQVIMTLPEPFGGQTNWGRLEGRALDFHRRADQLQAVAWFMDEALKKWQALAPKQLELAGFYWGVESSRATNTFLAAVAELVHARGKQFFWIPYWDPKGYQSRWRSFGFDAAWQQPNHFFHPEVPDSHVDEACRFARAHGLGLEMEFDGRMLSRRETFERRFDVYLDAFTRNGVEEHSSMAYYEGGDALYRLATAEQPELRAHYQRLARFVAQRQQRADQAAFGTDNTATARH